MGYIHEHGYIYLRQHKSYEEYLNFGATHSIKDSDMLSTTQEHNRGSYVCVFEVPYEQLDEIKEKIKFRFRYINNDKGGGDNFYARRIATLMKPYFEEENISHRKMDDEELDELLNRNRRSVTTNEACEIFKKNKILADLNKRKPTVEKVAKTVKRTTKKQSS